MKTPFKLIVLLAVLAVEAILSFIPSIRTRPHRVGTSRPKRLLTFSIACLVFLQGFINPLHPSIAQGRLETEAPSKYAYFYN